MNDVPGPATLYEDILHTNEIIKLFVGSLDTRVMLRRTRVFLLAIIMQCGEKSMWKMTSRPPATIGDRPPTADRRDRENTASRIFTAFA